MAKAGSAARRHGDRPTDGPSRGLNPEELAFFAANGFVGPFRALEPEAARALHERVRSWIGAPSRVYGRVSTRDRHLESRALCDACLHPAIGACCSSLLGPDLLLWRTTYMSHGPGHPGFRWHQDWDFSGTGGMPALDPVQNLNCWLALTDTTLENGCVGFIPKAERTRVPESRRLPGTETRGPRVVELEPGEAPVHVELEAGEFMLFDRGTLHGSGPNRTESERAGMALRITSTATRVYPGQRRDGAGFPLARWRALLLNGRNDFTHNRVGTPPEGEYRPMGPVAQLLARVRARLG